MVRNPIFDRARGIGMLLVIYGHMFHGIPFAFIFSFHMPLFFIMSGMLISENKIKLPYKEWKKHIIKKYIPPIVFFSIFGGIVNVLFFKTPDFRIMCKDFFLHMSSDELLTGAIWFLSMLGFVMLLMPLLVQIQQKVKWGGHIFTVVLSIAAFLLSKIPFTLPFLIKTIPTALLFVYLGYTYKKSLLQLINNNNVKRSCIFILPIFILLVIFNRTVNIAVPVYNDFFVYLICSLYGTIMTLQISTYKMSKFIEYIGKQSLIVFSLHAIWITTFVQVINNLLCEDYRPMVDLPFSYVLFGGIIVTVLTAINTALIAPIYNLFLRIIRIK